MKVDRKSTEVDPDIADIVPGPQPLPYDLPEELLAEKKDDDEEDEEDKEA